MIAGYNQDIDYWDPCLDEAKFKAPPVPIADDSKTEPVAKKKKKKAKNSNKKDMVKDQQVETKVVNISKSPSPRSGQNSNSSAKQYQVKSKRNTPDMGEESPIKIPEYNPK